MNIGEPLKKDYQEKDSNYFQLERHEMLEYVPENACRILDVGCGCGNFGRLLKDKLGVRVWGVELNEEAAAIAAQKLERVICGSFNSSLDLPKKEFDCIIFNDVLEHLVDPFAALIYAKDLLKKDGVVVAYLELNAEQGHMICGVKNLPLASGLYRFSIYITYGDKEIFDWIEDAASATVDGGDFFGTGSPGVPTHCKILVKADWYAT